MCKKPNLLYIFADQWRRDALGFMNEDEVITPNFDQFSSDSMVVDNATSCCPLCSPHRAALFSGRYPISNGVWTNCKTGLKEKVMLSPDEICIGNVLKGSGYNTGYIGKWHLDYPELNETDNPESGVVGWDAYTPPGEKRQGFDFWYSYGAMDKHLNPHYWKDTPKKIQPRKWSVEHETDVAIDFIKNRGKDEPFALFISWNPPHSPFEQVPEKYKEIYKDKKIKFKPNVKTGKVHDHTQPFVHMSEEELIRDTKDYYAAISGLDDNFGRLIELLKDEGIDDDTIVVVSADHGEMMGSHALLHKHVWYEESIGIPFIIRWKEQIKVGRSDLLLNSVDQMPTLLGLMDLEIPLTVEGVDLSPILRGDKIKNEPEEAFIAAYPGQPTAVKAFEELGFNNKAYGWRCLKTKKYTYVIHKGYKPNESVERLLYNNEEDKYQMNPKRLENANEDIVARDLEGKLKNILEDLKDPFEI